MSILSKIEYVVRLYREVTELLYKLNLLSYHNEELFKSEIQPILAECNLRLLDASNKAMFLELVYEWLKNGGTLRGDNSDYINTLAEHCAHILEDVKSKLSEAIAKYKLLCA